MLATQSLIFFFSAAFLTISHLTDVNAAMVVKKTHGDFHFDRLYRNGYIRMNLVGSLAENRLNYRQDEPLQRFIHYYTRRDENLSQHYLPVATSYFGRFLPVMFICKTRYRKVGPDPLRDGWANLVS